MLQDSGFTDVMIGEPVDTFGGAKDAMWEGPPRRQS